MTNSETQYFVYIMGRQNSNSVEVGMAGDLQLHVQRMTNSLSTTRVPDQKLVYYEFYRVEEIAVAREQQLKENSKDANCFLIESMNPNWLDLSDTLDY